MLIDRVAYQPGARLIDLPVDEISDKLDRSDCFEGNIGEPAVCAGPNFVLSVRRGSKQHRLGMRTRCEREPERLRQGTANVLHALTDAVVDRHVPILELLKTGLERVDERFFERGAPRLNIERLVARACKSMPLGPAVSSLLQPPGKRHGGRVPAVRTNTQPCLRSISDHLARIDASGARAGAIS